MTTKFAKDSVFGDWTIVSKRRYLGESGHYYRVCRCSCGRRRRVHENDLANGKTVRCKFCAMSLRYQYKGLQAACPNRKTRRRHNSRIANIMKRCYDPQTVGYIHYGGRGISVYEPWRTDRAAFMAYLVTLKGHGNPKLTLDRIDVNGNYEPGNLRFATRSQQVRNRRPSSAIVSAKAAYYAKLASAGLVLRH